MTPRRILPILFLLLLSLPSRLSAHQIIENALDIVIYPHKIVIDARIAMEEVLTMEADSETRPLPAAWPKYATQHAPYILGHLKIQADGQTLSGKSALDPTISPGPTEELNRAVYRFEYPLEKRPDMVSIFQDMMRERTNWQCSAIVRIRRSDIPVFQSALLTAARYIEFDLDWPKEAPATGPATSPSTHPAHGSPLLREVNPDSVTTDVPFWPTIRAYTAHGIAHILTGFDHLLFVAALVLAARSFWDLVKVVTAFTLAHTITLTLSVLNLVTLSSRIVEPMIAASITFVAIQNIFWPRQSRGWSRLAIAFAFGLFHGLGFAGGLKAAMTEMPAAALGIALISFSLGVEIGHQFVVIPLFVFLKLIRKSPPPADQPIPMPPILKLGSAAISLAGIYFFIQAIKG